MRFQTERPASWQVCVSCGNELTETDAHPRCPRCGGMLEVIHRPPDLTAPELMLRFTVYENQRWWLGLDWTIKLFPNERTPW